MQKSSRRKFIKASGLSIAGTLSVPLLSKGASINTTNAPEELTIIFQGDSITDAGRDRSRYYPNENAGMGRGYVFQIVSQTLGENPTKNWSFYNRGISGNKVYQLANRWDDDCLQLKPDVLSILIGVNDFWHSLKEYNGTVDIYEQDLRNLLDKTLEQYPNLKLIIGEPFAVKGGTAIDEKWFPDFPRYQIAANKIAKDYKAAFVPYQEVFDNALKQAPVSIWAPDGVHPSMAGSFLMKEAWIKVFNSLY